MRTSRFYILLLLAAVSTLLAACEPVSVGGRQVRFTASSGGSSMTKTKYDGENGGYAIIAWGSTDKIRIYSPSIEFLQGPDGGQIDDPTTTETTEYSYVYADYGLTNITRSGHEDKANLDLSAGNANGLSWKTDGGSATFFGAYPSTTGISWYRDGLGFNVVVPGSQTITFDGNGVHTPDISSYSLLAMQTANNGEAVNLRFFPAFTAFEFQLKSSNETITLNSVTLTTAEEDNAYMTGTCIYNPALTRKTDEDFFITNAGLHYFVGDQWSGIETCSKSLTVSFPGGTTISQTNSVDFTLFALPNDLSQMSITINCTVNGQTKDRKLNLKYSGGDWVTFPAGHKALITGLALDSGATWLLTINGEVLPWIYTEEETSFAQNVQSGPFVISNATETGNNYYPAGTKDYQVRTLDMSKDYGVTVVDGVSIPNKPYFEVTFLPQAPVGGYWQLVPESNGGLGTAAFKVEVWDDDDDIGSPDLKGQIMVKTVKLHITSNVTDEQRTEDHAIIIKSFFSTGIAFDEASTYSADSEIQDAHKDGSFSYWRFVIPKKNN